MLNYLGDTTGAGSMPAAVPGGTLGGDPMGGMMAGPGAMPAQDQAGQMPGTMPGMLGPGPEGDQSSQQFVAVTQEDGTVLLHLKRPDGSMGPVVKIVNAIKPKQA